MKKKKYNLPPVPPTRRLFKHEIKLKQAKIILASIIIDGKGYAYWNPKLKAAVKKFMNL
jgi:hypothetical protein